MSPLTLEKMTTPARLAAAPTAARWNQKTVADARDGGERARSGAGGRKRSVARGGALQNDDAVDDGDVYRLVGRRTRSRTQAKDASSHASCCSSAGGGDDGVRHENSNRAILNLSDAGSVLLQSRERAAMRPRARADSHDHGHDHSNSNATVADRPRQMSRRRAPADDDGEGARKGSDYHQNKVIRLREAPPGSVVVLGNRKINSADILMKPDRYFWETIITTRKVSIVALSVFGTELGVLRQSIVALLLLLGCIVLEIVGEPFRQVTEAHAVLKRLELGALLVEWGTLWCGLMIHHSGPRSEGMNVFMTFCVVLVNVGMMIWFLRVLVAAYLEEKKNSALVQRISRMRDRFGFGAAREGNPEGEENEQRKRWESFAESQVGVQARTFEAEGNVSFGNPMLMMSPEASPDSVQLEMAVRQG